MAVRNINLGALHLCSFLIPITVTNAVVADISGSLKTTNRQIALSVLNCLKLDATVGVLSSILLENVNSGVFNSIESLVKGKPLKKVFNSWFGSLPRDLQGWYSIFSETAIF